MILMLFLNTDSILTPTTPSRFLPRLSVQAWEQGTSFSSPEFFFSSLFFSIISTEKGTDLGSAGSSWLWLHQRSTCISTRALSACSSLCLPQPGSRCCSRSMWKEWPMTAAHLTSTCSSGLSWSSWFTAISRGKKSATNKLSTTYNAFCW